MQSALTIVLASIAMFVVDPAPGGHRRWLPVPFVVLVAQRYGRRARPALQEVQQRIAELTAEVEENVSGVRVVKSFAREERQLERFRRRVGRVFDQAMVSDPAAGVLQPAHRLPAPARAGRDPVLRRPPGHRRAPQRRRLHGLLHLPAHAAVADADAGHLAGHGPARDGLGRAALRDPRPRAADRRRRRTRRRCPPGIGARRAARRHAAVRRRARAGAARRLARRRGGQHGRARRRDRLGQDDARRSSSRASTTSTAGAVLVDGADVRDVDVASLRHADRDRRRRALPVLGDRRREHRLRARGRHARGDRGGGAARAGPRLHRGACPRATTRASASAG